MTAAGLVDMMMRESIIFALCLGIGAHIALAIVLHIPGIWAWNTAGLYGLLCGLAVYGLLQAGRAGWKLFQSDPKLPSKDEPSASW